MKAVPVVGMIPARRVENFPPNSSTMRVVFSRLLFVELYREATAVRGEYTPQYLFPRQVHTRKTWFICVSANLSRLWPGRLLSWLPGRQPGFEGPSLPLYGVGSPSLAKLGRGGEK
jgi:hypothetical protein